MYYIPVVTFMNRRNYLQHYITGLQFVQPILFFDKLFQFAAVCVLHHHYQVGFVDECLLQFYYVLMF